MRRLAPLVAFAACLALAPAAAAGETAEGRLVDRLAIRYAAPELGGVATPRAITVRELAFFARLEAIGADGAAGPDALARYGKNAYERLIAEDLLATIEEGRSGGEGTSAREALRGAAAMTRAMTLVRSQVTLRCGGAEGLEKALVADGLTAGELDSFLRRRAFALLYVDRDLPNLRDPSEEELLRAFRTANHPFRRERWEEARARFVAWYGDDRLRQAAADYLQNARNRVQIAVVATDLLGEKKDR